MYGIGTEPNPIDAIANAVRASLSGFHEASKFIAGLASNINPEQWGQISSKIQWAKLMIALGPPADGTMIGPYSKFCSGADESNGKSEWLSIEREWAEEFFINEGGKASVLDAIFGTSLVVQKIFVGRGIVGGEHVGVVTIGLDDIRLADGAPVWWKPKEDAMEALLATIGFISARKWVRWAYTHF
jgi:hypothetical protein